MRKFTTLIAVTLLAMACSKESTTDSAVGYGTIAFTIVTESEVETSATTRATSVYTIPTDLLPDTDEMSLLIEGEYVDPESGETTEYSSSFTSVESYNNSIPYLYAGDYTATVTDNKNQSVESDSNACFGGTVTFSVTPQKTISISIPVRLQNSIIRLTTTDNFTNYFANGSELTLSTDLGSELYFASPDNSENEDKILFVAPETTLYLEGWGQKQDPTESTQATVSTFTKSEIGTTVASQMSTVEVDAEYAGGAQLNITLNSSTTSIYEETVELNPISTTVE